MWKYKQSCQPVCQHKKLYANYNDDNHDGIVWDEHGKHESKNGSDDPYDDENIWKGKDALLH